MADGQIIRFKLGEAFPADDPLARWVTVCAMALNDLLLVNRWLWPRLKEEVPSEPYEHFYLARVASAHLFEAATFLRKSSRLPEIEGFVKQLDAEAQENYRALLAIGDGGSGKFYEQLKHVRNKSFHYQELLLGDGEEHERLKQAMAGHADDEREQNIRRGEIRDIPPPLTGFRAIFADDIATEMILAEDTEKETPDFVRNLSEHIAKLAAFTKAAFNAYTQAKPAGIWEIEKIQSEEVSHS